METYYLHLDNAQKGPFTIEQLRAMWLAGEIHAQTQFWTKANDEWRRLETIIGMFESPKPASVSPLAEATAAKVAALPPAAAQDWRDRMAGLAADELPSESGNNRPVRQSFPVLTFISALMRGVGWIVLIIGVFLLAVALFKMEYNERNPLASLMVLSPGFITGVSGLSLIAYGELVGVAFSIEDNTYKTACSLDNVAKALNRIASQKK